jgi:hypothetical protein
MSELAAAAGNAPALPVSETGVQTSTLSGKKEWSDGAVEWWKNATAGGTRLAFF